jgi:hypothetical protein
MGIHAFSDSAFLLTLDELCRVATPEHILGIQDAFRNLHLAYPADDAVRELCQSLSFVRTVRAFRDILTSYVSRVRESFDDELQHHEVLQDVFERVCYVLLPILPDYVTVLHPSEVDIGGAPTNTPVLRFSMNQCFSLEMTRVGRQLAQSLGVPALKPSTWTSMS